MLHQILAFGFSIGLSSPVDIHIPDTKEIYEMIEKEEIDLNVYVDDDNGNKYEVS